MAKFITEKRKANVGERILITGATLTRGNYANGDVCTVIDSYSGDVYVKEHPSAILSSEYEVIIEAKPSKSERISLLESQVAELQAKVEALQKRRKQATVLVHSPNESRKAVIERAKAFIEEQKRTVSGIIAKGLPAEGKHIDIGDVYAPLFSGRRSVSNAEFIINADKRAVTVLLKGVVTGKLYAKAIAKCAPDDVFNADIGKAIALGRALGLDVSEFENAVKPTEVVVGMVVVTSKGSFVGTPQHVTKLRPDLEKGAFNTNLAGYLTDEEVYITDDTEAQY